MSDLPELPLGEVPPPAACRIVFVCTGNTCRSPMAEAICKRLLADRLGCSLDELPAKGFEVLSAGLAAGPGHPAAEEAVALAESKGVEFRQHQSRLLTPELAEQANHLLGMTRGHVQAILDYFSVQARLLSPDGDDVDDPVGQPFEVYEDCAHQMAGCILTLVDGLVPLNVGSSKRPRLLPVGQPSPVVLLHRKASEDACPTKGTRRESDDGTKHSKQVCPHG